VPPPLISPAAGAVALLRDIVLCWAIMPAFDVRPARKGLLRLDPIPEILRPLIRAYLLGYASAVAPRLLTLVLQHAAKRRRKLASQTSPDRDDNSFIKSAAHIVKTGFNPQRFPTFCAILAGGTTLLKVSKLNVLLMLPYSSPKTPP
jgi:hypothetical protein